MSRRVGPLLAGGVAACALALLGAPAFAAFGQHGALRVEVRTAASKAPVAGARVEVAGAPEAAVTDVSGRARLTNLQAGPASVRVSADAFRPVEATVVVGEADATLEVFLVPLELRVDESIIVAAAREERRGFDVPRSTVVVSRQALDERAARTAPEILQDRSGGWVQKTNHGGGSPFIRGLVGNQVLVLVDGVRLNNATFRLGPNQYMNTIDPFGLDRVEIVRGSGSVVYGSDALGGVVNLVTPAPELQGSGVRARGAVATRLASLGMEQTVRAEGSVAGTRAGIRGGITARDFGDLVAGGSLGKEAPSGYREIDVDASAVWAPTSDAALTAVFQNVRQADVPRFDQVAQRGYAVYSFDPQARRLGYVQWRQRLHASWIDTARTTVSWQRSDEGRVRRKQGSSLETREFDTVSTGGVSVDLSGRLAGTARWSAGVEAYHDTVRSWRRDTNLASGQSAASRGLYPDGSTRLSLAGFALAQFTAGRAAIDLGARYTRDDVKAEDPIFGPLGLSPDAVVGSVAGRYAVTDAFHLFGSVSQAFRAPNIDDVSTLGAFDYGVEVPPAALDPERSLAFEGGFKLNTPRVAASASVYRMTLQDLIDRRPSRYNGSPQLDGQDVYERANVGRAFVRGAELDAEWRAAEGLSLFGFFAATYGQQVSAGVPMRRIPPANGLVGVRYSWSRAPWVEVSVRAAGAQRRLAPGDVADHRIAPGGTPGWTVVNVTAGARLPRGLVVSGGLANLFNEAYRIHGSGVDGAGRHAWLSLRVEF
ncbi:MAG TPA: TonB-dependent receptor [Vicinamibacterales bacterium]|nr:TonB-dependent receptor [Vicinamibacterales bacterium]HPW20460.1 TonB-dependent receptor [Vicinamibacterales bacterium]